MKIILFGATGMVGQGALRACLQDSEVEKVLSVSRQSISQSSAKLEQIIHKDFTDFSSLRDKFVEYDACLFCLGVSSVGMSEEEYRKITHDYTLTAGRLLAELNSKLRFIYVTGSGTDSSEKSRMMWARVKGRTENALLALPFEAYMFRPGYIQPLHGIQAKDKRTRVLYKIVKPLFPLLKRVFKHSVTTTEQLGRLMLHVAKNGSTQRIFETRDIADSKF